MLTNNQIAALAVGLAASSLMNAQSTTWQLSPTQVVSDAYPAGSDALNKTVTIFSFQADGSGGSLTLHESYPNQTQFPNGAMYICAAGVVKTTYSWTFSPNASYMTSNQTVNLKVAIAQDKSCHNDPNHPVYLTIDTVANFNNNQPAQAANNEHRYWVTLPAGSQQSDLYPMELLASNSVPTAKFNISIHSDANLSVPYTYSLIAANTPMSAMEAWVKNLNNAAFGAANSSSFDTSTTWQPGYTLCAMEFAYRTGTTEVYMAYQTANPSVRYICYFDPDNGSYTKWLSF